MSRLDDLRGGQRNLATDSPGALLVAAADVAELERAALQSGLTVPERAVGCAEVPLSDYIRLQHTLANASPDETYSFSRRPLMSGTADFALARLSHGQSARAALEGFAQVYNLAHGGAYNSVEHVGGRLIYHCRTDQFPFARRSEDAILVLMESILVYVHASLDARCDGAAEASLALVRTRRMRRRRPDGLLAFWRAPVKLGAASYGLEYDAGMLDRFDWTTPHRAVSLEDVHRHVRRMIAARETARPQPELLEDIVLLFEDGEASQSAIARRLGVSTATLRRRLLQHGVTFRGLRAGALNVAAKRALARGESVGEIAERLGYSDPRSFTRAFKSWNALPPSQFAAALHALCKADRPIT